MAVFTVIGVRKEWSSEGTHQHIAGVCTSDGSYWSRQDVVRSIENGHQWRTSAGGYGATIEPIMYCFRPGCYAAPYIMTNPDSTKKDNLENLDPC